MLISQLFLYKLQHSAIGLYVVKTHRRYCLLR